MMMLIIMLIIIMTLLVLGSSRVTTGVYNLLTEIRYWNGTELAWILSIREYISLLVTS